MEAYIKKLDNLNNSYAFINTSGSETKKFYDSSINQTQSKLFIYYYLLFI